jgi:hypothetical protein
MAINPDDMKIGLSYGGKDEGGNYMVRNGKKTYIPDDVFLRPPRRPQNPTSGGRFVNDYSFLNLPEPGSAVRSPIDIAQESLPPSVLEQINFSAPQRITPSRLTYERTHPPNHTNKTSRNPGYPKFSKYFRDSGR